MSYFSNLTIEEKRKILNLQPSILKQLRNQIKMGDEAHIIDQIGGPSYNQIIKKLSEEELDLLIKGMEASAAGDRLSNSQPLLAIEKYKEAAAILDWDEIAVMSIGCIYANIGRNKEALTWLNKAYKLNPSNARVKRNLAALRSL